MYFHLQESGDRTSSSQYLHRILFITVTQENEISIFSISSRIIDTDTACIALIRHSGHCKGKHIVALSLRTIRFRPAPRLVRQLHHGTSTIFRPGTTINSQFLYIPGTYKSFRKFGYGNRIITCFSGSGSNSD